MGKVWPCLLCCMAFCTAETQGADADWGPPYRIIYGGYSMEPGDWDLWAGTLNLVHHSLIGRDATEVRELLDEARKRRMKILTTAPIWDPKTETMNVSGLISLVDKAGEHPAFFGYVVEAAYRIPPATQKRVYDAIKEADSARPVWMEFSSTSSKTWELFNPAACDAVFTYNYPYEVKDRPGSNTVGRVRSSVNAIRAVNTGAVHVVPLLQTFAGTRWRKIPRGGVADQFDRWLALDTVAGVGFYRWRGRADGAYGGLLCDGTEDDYSWTETQQLCRQLAAQRGPLVDAQAWRKAAGRPDPSTVERDETALESEPKASSREPVRSVAFEADSMLLDQDWEDMAEGTAPAADWSQRGGTVTAGGAMGTGRAIKVRKGLVFRLAEPTSASTGVRLAFAIKPSAKGYAKGMVTLSDARTGYIAVGLRLGHGTAANSNVFSGLNAQGKWRSLGVPFVPDRWYRVVVIARGDADDIVYQIEDLESAKTYARSLERRFAGRGFAALGISADHAETVVVDEIRLESGRCSGTLAQ